MGHPHHGGSPVKMISLLLLFVPVTVAPTYLAPGQQQSNWLKGVQPLAVYPILAIVFYFAPGRTPQ